MSFLDSFQPRASVPTLDVPAAGAKAAVGEGKTSECLTFDEPLATPHEVKKYRKSFYGEPGARVQHPGLIDDAIAMREQLDTTTFGATSEGSNMEVKDVMTHGPQTKMADYLNERKESIYKSRKNEVLGKPQKYGTEFPDKCKTEAFAFGGAKKKKAKDEGTCKELLYPERPAVSAADEARAKELYRISHGSFEAGEQRRDGNASHSIDVHNYRFGLVDKAGEKNGVGNALSGGMTSESIAAQTASRGSVLHIVPKQLKKFKEQNDDVIGRAKNLGQGGADRPGQEFAYGVGSDSVDSWGAAECINGSYNEVQQQPDIDLGKAVAPGWRNDTTTNRTFGCPTIRTDIKPPKKRSVGDNNNYGDDTNAYALLHPAQYAGMGVEDADFLQHRDVQELRKLFANAGMVLSDGDFNQVYGRALQLGQGMGRGVGIEVFRRAFNELDDARYAGRTPSWYVAGEGKESRK
jgi:EF-hand domain-containing family member B